MGRVLYDEWATYWPSQNDDEPFSAFINNVKKYVISDTMSEATWNNSTVISGDMAEQIEEVKERTDGNIGMSGSATVVRWLLDAGFLDELNLLVHPIVVGHGRRLFDSASTHPLRLVKHQAFSTGVLHLTYVPADE